MVTIAIKIWPGRDQRLRDGREAETTNANGSQRDAAEGRDAAPKPRPSVDSLGQSEFDKRKVFDFDLPWQAGNDDGTYSPGVRRNLIQGDRDLLLVLTWALNSVASTSATVRPKNMGWIGRTNVTLHIAQSYVTLQDLPLPGKPLASG